MRKAQLGVLVGLLCGGMALGGCGLTGDAGSQAEQAKDAANQAVDDAKRVAGEAGAAAERTVGKGKACAEALGLTAALPDGGDLTEFREQAGERAQRLQDLATNVDGNDVRDALFRVSDFYVEVEQRRAESLGELNDWVQRNADRVDDLRTVCL